MGAGQSQGNIKRNGRHVQRAWNVKDDGSQLDSATGAGQSHIMNTSGCDTDLDCMNIDASRSTPGQPPVYSCKYAKCVGASDSKSGKCECNFWKPPGRKGGACEFDEYSGTCCQATESIRGDVFCIEYTEPPEEDQMNLSCKVTNQIFKHDGKEITIPGSQICEWCKSVVKPPEIDLALPTSEGSESYQMINILENFM
jgi:hypothetical protein